MNESDKFFASESAVLYRFLERCRPLVHEPDEGKMAYMFDVPKARFENLEELVKNGLPFHLAEYFYSQIEIGARRGVSNGLKTRRIADSRLAQVRAKYRGEESCIVDENRIKLESSREVNDLWRESVEHQAAM